MVAPVVCDIAPLIDVLHTINQKSPSKSRHRSVPIPSIAVSLFHSPALTSLETAEEIPDKRVQRSTVSR